MANIALGQSITGAFTTGDPLRSGYRLDEYDLTGFDDYRQLTIELTATNATTPLLINLVDTITGNVVDSKEAPVNGQGKISLSHTIFPGSSYRLVVGGQSGSYTVSTIDGGRATSIVTPYTARNNGDGTKAAVGTVGQNGQFFSLASSNASTDRFLLDIALGVDRTQFYALGSDSPYGNPGDRDILFKIDPSLAAGDQVREIGLIRDSATNNILSINLNALAYGPDDRLYATASGANDLYTINPTTAVATSVRSNMPGDLVSGGDLVYDPAGSRFLVASIVFRPDGTRGSSLWSIPLATSGTPTKIGEIGVPLVKGIDFENGQLKGFTGGNANAVGNRITIDTNTGAGTFETQLGNDPIAPINNGIGGATSTPAPTPTATRNDFNGDRKSDILWRNDSGGVALWQMNGRSVSAANLTSIASLDSRWTVAGTGDFTGDLKTDILWRNNNSVVLWAMDGANAVSSSLTAAPALDQSWKIAGTGDFSGDGKADMLWRNDNGSLALWQMNGSTVVSHSLTSISSVETSWKVAGTADFTGDGKADILWRNDNGDIALWQMNGSTVVSSSLTSIPFADTSWKVAGTADFTGDGKADILWRNDNGAVALWQMNGRDVVSRSLISTPRADSSWKIAGTNDFTGDSKADILWRNDSGAVAIWEMNSSTVLSAGLTSIPFADTSWKIAAPIL
jgi:FG-GAP-like repeat